MKHFTFLGALTTAVLLASCAKIEEPMVPANSDQNQVVAKGTAVLTVGGLCAEAQSLSFSAKTTSGQISSFNATIPQNQIVDGKCSLRIPLPADDYQSYNITIKDVVGEVYYSKDADDDLAAFSILEKEETFIGEAGAIAPDTKATVTATGRPWTGWNEANNVYSVGQFLGRYNIMQSLHVVTSGDIVYVQTKTADDGRKRNLRVVKCIPKSTKTSIGAETDYNAMELDWFGHGGTVCVEQTTSGDYIWIGCHGQWNSDKSEADRSQTIARFKWAGSGGKGKAIPKVLRTDMYDKSKNTTSLWVYKETNKSIYTDVGCTIYGDKLCIEHSTGANRWFKIYNLSTIKKLPIETFSVNNAINAGTTSIIARNIAKATPICTITIPNPKYSSGDKIDFQGFDMIELVDRYRIYALFGESNTTNGTNAKIVTKEWKFSTSAEANEELSSVYPFSHYSSCLASKFPTYTLSNGSTKYCEVEGLRVSRNETDQGKKIYIGFATRDNNSSGPGRANVLKYSRY